MTSDPNDRTIELSGGGQMPVLGFGTFQIKGPDARSVVRGALETGYRHLDTATAYENEDQVGGAVLDSGIDRDQIFITTKCPPDNAGRERATMEASLRALGTEYVDLWLIHWPPGGEARPEMWKVFIEVANEGKAAAIGVSNYSTGQIDELIKATGVAPAVNQIPWSPSHYDAELLAEHAQRGIVVEGYSGLKRSHLGSPVLGEVAQAHGVTPAQVVLRWHLEHNVVVIPKSVHRDRIEENFDLYTFSLSDEEVAKIDGLANSH
jgi:2,5-diketo-D-gluconate reductase A